MSVVGAIVSLAGPQVASAAGLTVAWNANPEPDHPAYVVFYAVSASGRVQRCGQRDVTRVRVDDLTRGRALLRAGASPSTAPGVESAPSTEVNGVALGGRAAAPSGSVQTYYAEGASGFFSYRVAVLNTTTAPRPW